MNDATLQFSQDEAQEFEAPVRPNGHAPKADAAQATTAFKGVSRKTAEAAKKGETSNSRTGAGKQVSYEFSKPPKNIYVKVHPNPAYSTFNLPTYYDETHKTFHYVLPELYEGDTLPERFKAACKIMNIYTTAAADGTFFLWYIFVSSSHWYKAAEKTVDLARRSYGIVSSLVARQTYSFNTATEVIPEPKWSSLPPFEQLLLGAFDTIVSVADDKVVIDFLSGGVASRNDKGEE
jgi:hypothetical protein